MTQNLAEAPVDLDNYDDRILDSLRRIIRAVDLYSRYLALRYSLTGPQLVCVRHLLRHGATAPGTLARRVSLSPATITGIVDRLEKRGLITRERSLEDKRKVEIALTDQGREIAVQMPPPLHETFSKRLRELPYDEQQEIDRVLSKIVGMMEAQELSVEPFYAENTSLPDASLSPFLNSGEPLDATASATDKKDEAE